MSEPKYVVIEYYESDHGGKPGDKDNKLAIHGLEDGVVIASEDGAPTCKEEAIEMLAAFNRPVYASVDAAEEEAYSNIIEYDGDDPADLKFIKAKTEAELAIGAMPISDILNAVASGEKKALEPASSNEVSWHMTIISVKVDGTKRREELASLGITNISKHKFWVECYIYKGLSFVGSCLINKDM